MLLPPRLSPGSISAWMKAQGEIVVAGEIDVGLVPDADGPARQAPRSR